MIWVATAAVIISSTLRALRIGHVRDTYYMAILCYMYFGVDAYHHQDTQQVVLNTFYVIVSLVGIYRWQERVEPKPRPEGQVVSDALIAYLKNRPKTQELVRLVQQRHQFGMQKYGQPLMSQDGRSGVEDAKEELGDLLQYCYKCRLNGSEDTKQLRRMLKQSQNILLDILDQ